MKWNEKEVTMGTLKGEQDKQWNRELEKLGRHDLVKRVGSASPDVSPCSFLR